VTSTKRVTATFMPIDNREVWCRRPLERWHKDLLISCLALALLLPNYLHLQHRPLERWTPIDIQKTMEMLEKADTMTADADYTWVRQSLCRFSRVSPRCWPPTILVLRYYWREETTNPIGKEWREMENWWWRRRKSSPDRSWVPTREGPNGETRRVHPA